jgi:predicted Zn-dependent protease
MTNSYNAPLPNSGQLPVYYRPASRTQAKNASHRLSTAQKADAIERPPSLFDAVEALEAWSQQERQKVKSSTWQSHRLYQLRVFIEASHFNVEQQVACEKALRAWQSISQGRLQFVRTEGDEHDISIAMTKEITLGRPYEVGHTVNQVSPKNKIMAAKIELVAEAVIDKQLEATQVNNRFYATILHEIGHALGLEHSEHEQDVMHYRGWKNTALSQGDIKAFETLYPETGWQFWV